MLYEIDTAQRIITHLLSSPQLRKNYDKRRRERAQYYTPERIVPKWEALLAEVAASGR